MMDIFITDAVSAVTLAPILDSIYLRLDCANSPLTGTLGHRSLQPTADKTYSIGDATHQLHQLFVGGGTAGSDLKTNGRGLFIRDTVNGDSFFGSDNLFPAFACVRAVKAGSTSTTQSEDASNMYFGQWGQSAGPLWPFQECMYGCGNGATGTYTFAGEDSSLIRNGAQTIGEYDGTRGGGGLFISGRFSGGGLYIYSDETNSRMLFRTMSASGKGAQQMSQIAFAGTRLTAVVALATTVTLGSAALPWGSFFTAGDLTHTGTKVGFYSTAPAARPAAYTQTYATATRTHANPTAVVVATTASTNVAPFGYTTAAQADAIVTAVNALVADMANVKQVLNSSIDDDQIQGLKQ